MIPYGRQTIDEEDIKAVVEVLRSDWLTTGPKVVEFEEAFAQYVGAKHAVAVSSGTAALHTAMYAIGIGPGDEVILPPITFAASANCVVYQGGTPVFSDVEPNTLLLDPDQIETQITSKTKAIIAVDYAGHPCDYDSLRKIADKHSLILIADACHALGAEYKGQKTGTLADLNIFSFHPVKHITTGEGGMITTENADYADRMRLFRNHGITRNPKMFTANHSPFTNGQRTAGNGQRTTSSWYYEMTDLGYNYRMTDFQCALGISQLRKLPGFLERRREIATLYDEALSDIHGIEPLGLRADVLPAKQSAMLQAPSSEAFSSNALRHAPYAMLSSHAYHLYVVKIDSKTLGTDRATIFTNLHERGIRVNVHYIPVHLHPFYREKFDTGLGLCPVAEAAYEQIISLPMFPGMTDKDVEKVIAEVKNSVCGRI
jgi:perosamine synthetase